MYTHAHARVGFKGPGVDLNSELKGPRRLVGRDIDGPRGGPFESQTPDGVKARPVGRVGVGERGGRAIAVAAR